MSLKPDRIFGKILGWIEPSAADDMFLAVPHFIPVHITNKTSIYFVETYPIRYDGGGSNCAP